MNIQHKLPLTNIRDTDLFDLVLHFKQPWLEAILMELQSGRDGGGGEETALKKEIADLEEEVLELQKEVGNLKERLFKAEVIY